MSSSLRLTHIDLAPASRHHARAGLLGFVSVEFDGALRIDGLTVRVTRDGRHTLSWPARRDRHGEQHPIVLPVGAEERHRIKGEILRRLGLEPEAEL